MREIEARFWMLRNSPLSRALRVAAIAVGVGLVMAAGPVRAGDDDEDDDRTFEEKIVDNIMRGVGATNMENRGIEYRERSPLVVPPKLDLPPPASSAAEIKAPNWPKDPDEQRRKAAIAARKKEDKDPQKSARVLTPAEMAVGKTAPTARTNSDPIQPGTTNNSPALSPSALGFTGFGNIFGGNKMEEAPFKGEPTRDSLTQPPPGYQTPSSSFAYGTGPKESLNKPQFNVMTGKEQ